MSSDSPNSGTISASGMLATEFSEGGSSVSGRLASDGDGYEPAQEPSCSQAEQRKFEAAEAAESSTSSSEYDLKESSAECIDRIGYAAWVQAQADLHSASAAGRPHDGRSGSSTPDCLASKN